MSKGIFSSTKSFAKNLMRHVGWVISRKETMGHAMSSVRKDTRKLSHKMGHATHIEGNRDKAIKYMRRGRRHYNRAEYGEAEEYFRKASIADPHYGLAYAYLGHTYWQTHRYQEAIANWQWAVEKDPGSEGALKATQKLRMLRNKENEVNAWLESYIDKERL